MPRIQSRLLAAGCLAAMAAVARLLPHPQNFTPVGGLALFAAATCRSPWNAVLLTLAAMAASDAVIGWHALVPVVYVALALTVPLGRWLRPRQRPLPILAATVGAAIVLFLISNLGVFLFQDLYPRTAAGLMSCYVAAIPFLLNSVLGNIAWSALLFGAGAMLERCGLVPADPSLSG